MKKTCIAFIAILVSAMLHAQSLHIHIGAGMMNYGGDLQEKLFTFQKSGTAFSAGLSYKPVNHLFINAAFTTGSVKATDAGSINYKRNLNFYSRVNEGSITAEADLFDIPSKFKITPYIFVGASVYHFNPYTYDTSNTKYYLQPLHTEGQGLPQYPERKDYKLTQLAFAYGFGIKYYMKNDYLLSAELNFRKLFTDYFDDVSTRFADTALLRAAYGAASADLSFRGDELKPPLAFYNDDRRGNPARDDVFYTLLIKLSIPLHLGLDKTSRYNRRLIKQYGCPAKVL